MWNSKLPFRLLIVSLVALSATACGSSNQEPSTDPIDQAKTLIDPCSLISKSEVEEVLKTAVNDAEASAPEPNPLGMRHCGFYPVQPELNRMLQITIIQDQGISTELRENGQTAALVFEGLRTENSVDLNIGDDAFLMHAGRLEMLKKGIYVEVMTSALTPSEEDYDLALAASQEFASRIADRL